ncbi:GH3 auxin-responsive promoter family protein [Acetobacterium bakii]|uniref:Auxin-responsive protein n=1 Tax=Acetobacterium bakii TaxID=52689 RepID=A0A0L6TWA5_9FIRM|nr:GH3 auxin-responsive promoter family protein [Acetobacterium bakii]KNZ40332.1 hypothetical protein AKG39_18240 [Acetobacterium bakii]
MKEPMKYLMYEIMTLIGRCIMLELRKNSKNANKRSHRKLLRLLHKNRNTAYGKKYHFAEIHSYDDFRRRVPLSDYSDYDGYIKRMLDGETNLITAAAVDFYADSSGSTGNPKRIPVTRKAALEMTKYTIFTPFAIDWEYFKQRSQKLSTGSVLFMQEYSADRLSNGAELGCITETPLKKIKPFLRLISATPLPVIFPSDIKNMDMKYLKMRFSIEKRDVTYINAIYGIVVYEHMRYLEEYWELLCDDIEKGIISAGVQLSEANRRELRPYLKPNPKRAAELRAIFKKGFDTPVLPQIWPRYSFTTAIFTGSFAFYLDKLKKYVGDLPFSYFGYGASECGIAVADKMNSGDFPLVQDGAFYEFIPEDGGEPLTMDQLTVGENYELVVTNLSGLYRYRMGDMVLIKGFMNELPIINFAGRKDKSANIVGEKTTEEHFSYAVKELSQGTGMDIIDYGVWVDKETEPPCYVIFIETPMLPATKAQENKYRHMLEDKLNFANSTIAFYIDTKQMGRLTLCYLKTGTYSRYFDMLNKKAGTSNQIKPAHIIVKPELADFFHSNCKNLF